MNDIVAAPPPGTAIPAPEVPPTERLPNATDTALTALFHSGQVGGRRLFYPCAGEDLAEPLARFCDVLSVFHFEDLHYDFRRAAEIPLPGERFQRIDRTLEGPRAARTEQRRDDRGRSYPFVTPATLTEVFYDRHLQRELTVIRRRGAGQFGLRALPERELAVFMHRGDGCGEGGSGAFFLANRKRRVLPLSNLMNEVKTRLHLPGLIVSDGSNTSMRGLLQRWHGDDSAPCFEEFGLRWQRVAELGKTQRGRTGVWRVSEVNSEGGVA